MRCQFCSGTLHIEDDWCEKCCCDGGPDAEVKKLEGCFAIPPSNPPEIPSEIPPQDVSEIHPWPDIWAGVGAACVVFLAVLGLLTMFVYVFKLLF